MRIVVSIIVCAVLAATATAGGPAAIYPKDLGGGLHEWQARASMHLAAECTGNQCDEYAIEPGTVYLLGTVVDYGRETRVVQMGGYCVWDGTRCGEQAVLPEPYDVWMTWNEDAGCYLLLVETSPDTADFDSLTMESADAGYVRIGAFDIKADKVYHYSKDVTREVWSLEKWWPELPPSNEPN